MTEKQPVYILPENMSRTIGKEAQRSNILAVKVIADIVKTTLGPKGMDKMIVDSAGNIIVTNDGVTILEEMSIDHPAAKMIVEIAKTQEAEVGDGTTTVALLAGKLLECAERLLNKNIHPTTILKGYRLAAEKSMQILNDIAMPIHDKNILIQIAQTAMTGKGAESDKETLSGLIVKAVDQVVSGKDINLEDIKIERIKGGSVAESELMQGIALDKERANADMPSKIKDAKILLIDIALELRNPETEARISVSTPEQLEKFIESEEKYVKDMALKIIASGANVVFCQRGIDDVAQYYLAKAGIFACRRVSKSDMEKLARATNGKITSNLSDLGESILGKAEIVEEIRKNDNSMTFVKGCYNPRAVTIIIKGSTSHVIEEIERAVKDGLGDVIAAVKSGKIVPGGGAIEIELARRLRIYARTLSGREQLAVEEFANALESIPEALAENAGLDPIDIITELRKRHESGLYNHGLNLLRNEMEDTYNAGIIEPLKVKTQAISSAAEVAAMILRIDDVLISAKSPESISSEARKEDYRE